MLPGDRPKACGDIGYFRLDAVVYGPSAAINFRRNDVVRVCEGVCWHPRSGIGADVCRTMCPPPAWWGNSASNVVLNVPDASVRCSCLRRAPAATVGRFFREIALE